MGKLIYDGEVAVTFDDRLLAHLQAVIGAKLRRSESFYFTWKDSVQTGGGRTTIWLGPWPLIVDTVSVRLCRFRERSGACGFVGVRADVADRGVASASVVAVRPPEHGPVGGGLVRER